MILADTSVWIEHLRVGDDALAERLERGEVASHPFVLGELACGNLARRSQVMEWLDALPRVKLATHEEALHLVDAHELPGSGLGWIDVHLLASARLSGCTIWTKDRALAQAAERVNA